MIPFPHRVTCLTPIGKNREVEQRVEEKKEEDGGTKMMTMMMVMAIKVIQMIRMMGSITTPSKFLLLLFIISSVNIGSITSLCPSRCFCDEDKLSVDCRDANLDLVPITLNPSLSELYLGNNLIKSISSSFIFYRKLEFLDLENNAITSIEEKHFSAQKFLKVLLLNKNRIAIIMKDSFYGLSSLRLLSVVDNELEGIEGRAFESLINLEKLDLSINKLSILPTDTFVGLINLKSLSLRSNDFKYIPRESLRVLGNLTKLDLALNPLTTLHQTSFPGLVNLKELNLEGCQINSIDPFAFLDISGLKSLNLDANQMSTVPSESLQVLSEVEKLSIGKNQFETLPAGSFKGLIQLKHMTLRGDKFLQSIDPLAFQENVNLYKVIIESCPRLSSLDGEIFSNQKSSLKHLSLRSNGLTTLDKDSLPWETLHHLDLRGNPFNCSCSLIWFHDLIQKGNFSTEDDLISDVVCEDPIELRGHRLASVPFQLTCFESSILTDESKGSLIMAGTVLIIITCLLCTISCAIILFVRSQRRRKEQNSQEQQLKSFFTDFPNYNHSSSNSNPNSSNSPRSLDTNRSLDINRDPIIGSSNKEQSFGNTGFMMNENDLNQTDHNLDPYQIFYERSSGGLNGQTNPMDVHLGLLEANYVRGKNGFQFGSRESDHSKSSCVQSRGNDDHYSLPEGESAPTQETLSRNVMKGKTSSLKRKKGSIVTCGSYGTGTFRPLPYSSPFGDIGPNDKKILHSRHNFDQQGSIPVSSGPSHYASSSVIIQYPIKMDSIYRL